MLHLSRLAEDWILYSSEEFGWLELGDGVTSGSSLMPQKKNPDSLELIRGKSGRVFGDFTSLFVTMKGLPMTYNRDMQEDKEPLFDAAAQLAASLEMMAAVVESSPGETSGSGRRKLDRRNRSGRSSGASRNAISSRPSTGWQTRIREHSARQTTGRLDCRPAQRLCAGIYSRDDAPARPGRGDEDPRASGRRWACRGRKSAR